MSIAGAIAIRGAEVRVLRPTTTRNADGSSAETWAELARQQLHLVDGAASRAQQVWGQLTETKILAFAVVDADVALRDAILVQDGAFAGERFRVAERRRETRRQRHLLLGLVPTTETFLVDGLTV